MSLAIQPEPGRASAPSRPVPPLHPAAMTIGPEGVPGCAWPLPLDELKAARDRFLSDLFAWIRLRDVDRDADAELVWLNAAPIAMEVLRLFNGWAVIERLRAAERLPTPPADGSGDLFDRLAAGQAPGPSPYTAATLRGLASDPLWRKALRGVKYALGDGPIRYRPRPLIRPERDIVTFTVDPLITAHARRSERPVVLSKFDEWMSTGHLGDRVLDRGIGPEARRALMALVKGLFARAGVPLPTVLETHLRDVVERLTGRTRIHLDELLARERELPGRFWPGTGGILYNRVFARAVQRAGGEVTGHDHSASSGWWRARERTVSELNVVDRFVTYGATIAEGLRRDLDPELLGRPGHPPEIVALAETPAPAVDPAPPAAPACRPAAGPGRKLMYVMNLYIGDAMGLWPCMPDLVAVDWQIRLLRHLRRRGFAVQIKPHPESHSPPPAGFAEQLGAEIVGGSCEAVMPQADVLLFDFPGATCLLHALRGDRPIVLVDFPHLELATEARALLERRVALVPGHLDESGRAAVDWEALDTALTIAPSRLDRGFVDTYFPAL